MASLHRSLSFQGGRDSKEELITQRSRSKSIGTRRFTIHFTEVRETKGLEFDVVVVPDLGAFNLDSAVGRNQMYVAITRAKHALILGSDDRCQVREEIRTLERNHLVHVRELALH
jgi:superfamily I DNA/RNA helicase